ncbi:MAG TPA: DUF2845 domain-containing protein [Polyangia bacterium]
MRALVLAFCLAPAAARADDGLRCGQWLVSTGAREAEVADKCGPPTSVTADRRCFATRHGVRCLSVDVWTYDRGPTEFVRTLELEYGVLVRVSVGDYGTR